MKAVTFVVSHRIKDDALIHGVSGARYSKPHHHIAVSVTTLCGVVRDDYIPIEEPINCLACLAARARPDT